MGHASMCVFVCVRIIVLKRQPPRLSYARFASLSQEEMAEITKRKRENGERNEERRGGIKGESERERE